MLDIKNDEESLWVVKCGECEQDPLSKLSKTNINSIKYECLSHSVYVCDICGSTIHSSCDLTEIEALISVMNCGKFIESALKQMKEDCNESRSLSEKRKYNETIDIFIDKQLKLHKKFSEIVMLRRLKELRIEDEIFKLKDEIDLIKTTKLQCN